MKYQMKQNWFFKSNQRFSKQKIDEMEHQPWSIFEETRIAFNA